MYLVTVDPRDGGSSSTGVCNKCCCEPIGMRAGETQMLTVNVAPWSVPLGGRGIVPPVLIDVQPNTESCGAQVIDGFANPNFVAPALDVASTPPVSPQVIDYKTGATPSGNEFSFKLEPLTGPSYGSVVVDPAGLAWSYTPNPQFSGYDSYWVRMTDAQGRSVVKEQVLRIGNPVALPPYTLGKSGLVIDRSKIQINSMLHQIQIPLYLAPNAGCDTIEGCIKYRATFKITVDDCNNLLTIYQCFDVFCVKC